MCALQNGLKDANGTVEQTSSAASRSSHAGGLADVLKSSLYSASGAAFETGKHPAGDTLR